MKEGDVVTGVDRSYMRSIYQVVSIDPPLLNFVSFAGTLAKEIFQISRNLADYRLATSQEIEDSKNKT